MVFTKKYKNYSNKNLSKKQYIFKNALTKNIISLHCR
ncbi:hypothetical protein CHY_2658 [Carboxydothermus hydrogenoformans Z-2901]|uniref:Uncharacterized protein n=1 Tax=Carboxydothermus hydrogenoformans (strain ATCC BAA-161 / DSM 6008 / Z-2901) TaxID=246194 RepID=Q3A8T4_CARHZ|nr:hypothetical protein CHY_2658 [Carboxydothermus hydrogenoformans Z-2901]